MFRKKLFTAFLMGLLIVSSSSIVANAEGTIQPRTDVSQNARTGDNIKPSTDTSNGFGNSSSSSDSGVADYLGNMQPMTSEHMGTASMVLTPITNLIGYLMGGVVALTSVGIFGITAIDFIYIAFPFMRGFVGKWISDEARLVIGGAGSSDSSQGSSPMGGGSMGGAGMFGGSSSGFGGFGGTQSQYSVQGASQGTDAPKGTKPMLYEYFKKRAVFIVLFVVCSIVLLNSAFIGTGVNLAKWIITIIEAINDFIPGAGAVWARF